MPGTLNLSTPAQLVNNDIVIQQGFLKFSTFYNCPIWCGIRHTIGEAGPQVGFFGGLEITQNEAGRWHVACAAPGTNVALPTSSHRTVAVALHTSKRAAHR
jgi:hypothetical protein